MRFDGSFHAATFAAIETRTDLVQLHREPVTIGDREVEPDVVADGHGRDRETTILHVMFEARAAFAARRKDGERLAAKRMDHASRVDSRPPGESLLERM